MEEGCKFSPEIRERIARVIKKHFPSAHDEHIHEIIDNYEKGLKIKDLTNPSLLQKTGWEFCETMRKDIEDAPVREFTNTEGEDTRQG